MTIPNLPRPGGPDNAPDRQTITLTPGELPTLIDQAEKVLLANCERLQIFQRAGEVVRIMSLDRRTVRGDLKRPEGTVQLAPVTQHYLTDVWERLIHWRRQTNDGSKPANCPTTVAVRYLARCGEWSLPDLRGVIEAPILRPDGSLFNCAGYDGATGLFLHSSIDWSGIPNAPTAAQAEDALHVLLEPFADFPFVTEADRSVLIAGVLTAIQRRLLESAPLFGFSAPAQRSGKSLLAESIGVIATGRKPAATGVAAQQEEFRKAITSALREGHLIVNLDNITHPLGSADLARAITQSLYEDRLLGTNQMLRLPTNLLWTATGNNLTFRGDLPSRALLCRIDSGVERPEERTFAISDLPAHLLAKRRQLVTAALTVLRAYEIAGRPQETKLWGGFDHWTRTIRAPLIWLGQADPCATREGIIANDPERDLIGEILTIWHKVFSVREMLVREIIAEIEADNPDCRALRTALLTVADKRDEPGNVDPRRLGAWCQSAEGRIVDGFRLDRCSVVRHATTWRVSSVSCVSQKPVGSNQDYNGGAYATDPISNDRRKNNSPDSPNSQAVQGEPDEMDRDAEIFAKWSAGLEDNS